VSFGQRVINTILTWVYTFIFRDLYSLPKVHSMLSNVFPEDDIPHINHLIQSTALLINHGSPFLGDGLRPVMPKTILAGFMSCSKPIPLPHDLKDWVQEAEHGVILVSFGSVVKASKMADDKKRIMLKVFSKLKQRIIWKWESPMEDAPPNVLISAWLPQTSLLAHENVKVFVTHGGAGSIQETICHNTPIVGIPFGMDQFLNVNEAVRKNYGELIYWHDLTVDNFSEAISKVLTRPEYTEAVSALKDLIMDQPQHPLDKAAWWLEYLLRHPHNSGMKSPALRLYWFQYFLLDGLLVFLVSLLLVYFLIRYIYYKCCTRTKKKSD